MVEQVLEPNTTSSTQTQAAEPSFADFQALRQKQLEELKARRTALQQEAQKAGINLGESLTPQQMAQGVNFPSQENQQAVTEVAPPALPVMDANFKLPGLTGDEAIDEVRTENGNGANFEPQEPAGSDNFGVKDRGNWFSNLFGGKNGK